MRKISAIFIALLFAIPSVALAHTNGTVHSDFMHGFTHPLGGFDHLLAMVAVGIWGAQIGGRAIWVLPSLFVIALVLGGALGLSGIVLPFIESGIIASVLILGVMIATASKLPLVVSSSIVAIFAIFHGSAHGAEMPASISAAWYAIGFAMASALLHFSGMGIGSLLKKDKKLIISRVTGSVITLLGVYLAIA